MLIDFRSNFLLDQKREKAKARIEQLLAPIWAAEEIPKIADLDHFNQLAEPLWNNTGSNFLGDLLGKDAINRPLFEISREIEQLKPISEFVISELGNSWMIFGPVFEPPYTASIPLFSTDSIIASQPCTDGTLWESLDYVAVQKINSYVSEFPVVLGATQSSYYLTTSRFDPWQQIESYVRLYASSYISRLLYVHRALERLLTEKDSSGSASSLCFFFHSTKKSYKITPQILKRPPPLSAVI